MLNSLRLIRKNYALSHLRGPILYGLINPHFAKNHLNEGFTLYSALVMFVLAAWARFSLLLLMMAALGFLTTWLVLEYLANTEVATDIQRILKTRLRLDYDQAKGLVKLEKDELGWVFWLGSHSYQWDSKSERLLRDDQVFMHCLREAEWEFVQETGYWRLQGQFGQGQIYVSLHA